MRKQKLLFILLFTILFTSCVSKDEKKAINVVDNALIAAKNNDLNAFIQMVPFLSSFNEVQQKVYMTFFSQIAESDYSLSIVNKKDSSDIYVKVTFGTDAIILVCKKDDLENIFLSDEVLSFSEYDYLDKTE